MPKYKKGDIVNIKCSVNDSTQPTKDIIFSLKEFKILGTFDDKYIIPNDLGCTLYELKNNAFQEYNSIYQSDMDMSFTGRITWVDDTFIVGLASSQKSAGLACCECSEFYSYAEANMSDGRLCCYACRQTYSWKYSKFLK